jgi:hypothetical protein
LTSCTTACPTYRTLNLNASKGNISSRTTYLKAAAPFQSSCLSHTLDDIQDNGIFNQSCISYISMCGVTDSVYLNMSPLIVRWLYAKRRTVEQDVSQQGRYGTYKRIYAVRKVGFRLHLVAKVRESRSSTHDGTLYQATPKCLQVLQRTITSRCIEYVIETIVRNYQVLVYNEHHLHAKFHNSHLQSCFADK